MSKSAGTARAALLGMLCAMVAFTYAIASVPASLDTVDAVGSRGVGTSPLRFTNPLDVSGDRDLGDVVLGGSFTRFARAAGGLPPYKFSSNNISGLVSSILSSGVVDFSGKVSGSVAPAANIAAIGGSIRFNITVTDQRIGTNSLTEVFRLSVDSSGLFKFADNPNLGSVPRVTQFSTQLSTINGKGNVSFAVTSVSGITGVTTLSDVGLFLDSTGKIFGKPYLQGTIAITVTATDSTGALAASRAGTGSNQVYSLTIEPSVDTTSDVFVTKAQIKYDAVKSAKKAADSVSISGNLNVKGAKVSDFATKKFSVEIGNFKSVEVTLSNKGKTADKTVNKTANISLSTKGTFKASFKALNISTLFPGIADGSSTTLPTGVTLTDSVSAVDPLIYSAKGASGKQTLSYAIGKNAAPAGAFLITSVKGKDSKDGAGTSFQVGFLALPSSLVKGVAGTLTGVTKAGVSIGNVTDDTLVATAKGSKISAKAKTKDNNKVTSLSVDTVKGKGSLKTTTIVAGATGSGIPLASGTTTTQFPLAVAISSPTLVLYNGFGSVGIFGKKTSYVSVNPAK